MKLTRNYIFSALVGLGLGLGIFSYLHFGQVGEALPDPRYQPGLFAAMLAGMAALLLFRLTGQWLNSLLPWHKKLGLRLFSGIVVHLALGLLVTWTLILAFRTMNPWSQILPDAGSGTFLKLVVILFFLVFIHTLTDFAFYSYNYFATTQIAIAQRTRTQLELQYEVLRSQLHPHFLFNALNTVSALIYNDANLAEEFIRNMARTYQYILQNNNSPLVPLSEELHFFRAYKFMLKTRFGNALALSVEVPDEIQTSFIPPLTLQLLVENAVKHNQLEETMPLKVDIFLENNQLIVENSLVNMAIAKSNSTRLGIGNIKKRYAFFTDRPVEVKKENTFRVGLPLLYHPSNETSWKNLSTIS